LIFEGGRHARLFIFNSHDRCGSSGRLRAARSFCDVKALQERLAPPTINIENLDPAVTVDVVRDTPRALPAGDIAALNDSFGFGGHNVVLAFKSL
jgi:3-oxoacyl-[acyl-carrier-protein] synthase II